ncbi:MAG: OmpA family protein [Chitinophagaceae bacterium]|nr:OmpA family protein [Chitinophagaceae bacterium]
MVYHADKPQVSIVSSPTKTLHIDTLTVPEVLFATNSFILNKRAVTLLDSFTRKITSYSVDSVVVNGHTDATGSDMYNKELSWRRAASVAAYLQQSSRMNIVTRGFGSGRPVADNRTAAGKQKNRRVEIFIYISD